MMDVAALHLKIDAHGFRSFCIIPDKVPKEYKVRFLMRIGSANCILYSIQ